MADYRQDEPSRTTDTGIQLANFDVQCAVILPEAKRGTPGYTVPSGLANLSIRDVTADIDRLPQEWVQKARDAASSQGISAAPTFVGIMNDNGKATLILGWTR